jgi:hypothetical protein
MLGSLMELEVPPLPKLFTLSDRLATALHVIILLQLKERR